MDILMSETNPCPLGVNALASQNPAQSCRNDRRQTREKQEQHGIVAESGSGL